MKLIIIASVVLVAAGALVGSGWGHTDSPAEAGEQVTSPDPHSASSSQENGDAHGETEEAAEETPGHHDEEAEHEGETPGHHDEEAEHEGDEETIEPGQGGVVMNIGKPHVIIVHFPIALGLAAFLADLLWVIMRSPRFRHAGLYCLVLAALSGVPAVIMGLAAAGGEEYAGDYARIVDLHKYFGMSVLGIAVLAASIRLIGRDQLKRWWLLAYCVLMVGLVIAIGFTGHLGGMLVHGKDFLSGIF
jgi:uncharacterized membrane protein